MQTFQQAADIAKRLKSSADLATAALGFEDARWRFHLPSEPAVDLLEEALSMIKEEDSPIRVRLLANLARAIVSQSRERADALINQAIESARRMNDPFALMDSLSISFVFQREPEKIQERITSTTELMQLASELGDDEKLIEALGFRFCDLMELGNIQAVDADMKAMYELAGKLQQPFFSYLTLVHSTMRILLEGQFQEGMTLAKQALDIGEKIQVGNPDGTFGLQMFTIFREQGHLQTLGPAIKSFMDKSPTTSTWQPALALIYCDLDMAEEAQKIFEHLAENNFSDLPRDSLWTTCIAYLSEVCAYLRDSARADTLYQHLLPYNGFTILTGNCVTSYGAASRYLGLLATTMGHREDAERHFKDALEMNAQMGAKPWLAHTQHDYAAMLLERDEPGDCKKADNLLEKTHSTAWELGMTNLVKKVDKLKTQYGYDEKLDRLTDTG
jgi:tetratricopeptide (TPR) repeat protein